MEYSRLSHDNLQVQVLGGRYRKREGVSENEIEMERERKRERERVNEQKVENKNKFQLKSCFRISNQEEEGVKKEGVKVGEGEEGECVCMWEGGDQVSIHSV